MSVAVTTPATAWPVTLAEAKAQCRVDGSASDALLQGLIQAGTDYTEAYCGRSFSAKTLTLYLDEFTDEMTLPRGPVAGVSSVKYYDTADTLQTLSATIYEADLRADPAAVVLAANQSWPVTDTRKNAVQIEYTVSGDCPASVKQALLVWIEARFDSEPVPDAFGHLLINNRSYGV